ncbi:hypothetical protein, partial [Helicobacter typhlonius]
RILSLESKLAKCFYFILWFANFRDLSLKSLILFCELWNLCCKKTLFDFLYKKEGIKYVNMSLWLCHRIITHFLLFLESSTYF